MHKYLAYKYLLQVADAIAWTTSLSDSQKTQIQERDNLPPEALDADHWLEAFGKLAKAGTDATAWWHAFSQSYVWLTQLYERTTHKKQLRADDARETAQLRTTKQPTSLPLEVKIGEMIPARYFKTIVVDDDVFDNFTNQLEGLPYEVKLALAPKIKRSSGVGQKIAASLSDSDLIGFPYTHQDGSAFKRTELSPFMINRCCDYVVAVTGESVNRVG